MRGLPTWVGTPSPSPRAHPANGVIAEEAVVSATDVRGNGRPCLVRRVSIAPDGMGSRSGSYLEAPRFGPVLPLLWWVLAGISAVLMCFRGDPAPFRVRRRRTSRRLVAVWCGQCNQTAELVTDHAYAATWRAYISAWAIVLLNRPASHTDHLAE